MKCFIKKCLVLLSIPVVTCAITHPEFFAPSSLADHLHLMRSKDPIDGGWLANLTGLPDKHEVKLLDEQVRAVMAEETEGRCNAIEPQLRMLFFAHFAVYQKMANAQNIYLNEKNVAQWAHVMAMTLDESSGDSTNITDFQGHSYSTHKATSNLLRWQKILTLSANTPIKLDFQTNFGLTQASTDRVFLAFKLAKDQQYDTSYLEGIQGAQTPHKVPLNTAIAVRRLIWFYQDFAQGRINQQDKRIHKEDIDLPGYAERYDEGIDAAIMYCGTRFMFEEGKKDFTKLKEAMKSISYCKLGNAQQGYGKKEFDEKCFAQWVTICPALNIDIATITPLQYFATRNAKPVCQATFRRLLVKKPSVTQRVKHWLDHKEKVLKSGLNERHLF